MGLFDVLNRAIDVLSSDNKSSHGSDQSKSNKPVTALEAARLKAIEGEKQKIYEHCYSDVVQRVPDLYANNRKDHIVSCNYALDGVKIDHEVADAVMEKAVRDALRDIELSDYSLSKNSGTFASRHGGSLVISWK